MILETPKGTIILTTTHILAASPPAFHGGFGLSFTGWVRVGRLVSVVVPCSGYLMPCNNVPIFKHGL